MMQLQFAENEEKRNKLKELAVYGFPDEQATYRRLPVVFFQYNVYLNNTRRLCT